MNSTLRIHRCLGFFAIVLVNLLVSGAFRAQAQVSSGQSDSQTTERIFEKEYGNIEQLAGQIRDEEKHIRSLESEISSLKSQSPPNAGGSGFQGFQAYMEWRTTQRKEIDAKSSEISEAKKRKRELESDYQRWDAAKKKFAAATKVEIPTKESGGFLGKLMRGSAGVKYTPPLIPLSIAFDSSGEIQLSCEGKIPTPIGTFEIYKNVSFGDKKTLTVVLGDKKHVYDIEDRSFKVSLPNDQDGKSKIEYDGRGNIVVLIPHPIPSNP